MRNLLILFCYIALVGCRPSAQPTAGTLVNRFGSYPSPDASMLLNVSRRAKAIVDFDVIPSDGGPFLVSGTIGSDAMRWFLYWDSPTHLWAYGSDAGYFMHFDFSSPDSVQTIKVGQGDPIPRAVWEALPSSKQKLYPARKATGV